MTFDESCNRDLSDDIKRIHPLPREDLKWILYAMRLAIDISYLQQLGVEIITEPIPSYSSCQILARDLSPMTKEPIEIERLTILSHRCVKFPHK